MANVAILLGPLFEDSEFRIPAERLAAAGHQLTVVGSRAGEQVTGKRGEETVSVEAAARDLRAADFDALVIPGGQAPDKLRMDPDVVGFVRAFARTGRPLAAVCHGPQLLIEADLVRGRKVTSWPSVRKDLENAGAHWMDRQVVVDAELITSRKPDDLVAFSEAVQSALARNASAAG